MNNFNWLKGFEEAEQLYLAGALEPAFKKAIQCAVVDRSWQNKRPLAELIANLAYEAKDYDLSGSMAVLAGRLLALESTAANLKQDNRLMNYQHGLITLEMGSLLVLINAIITEYFNIYCKPDETILEGEVIFSSVVGDYCEVIINSFYPETYCEKSFLPNEVTLENPWVFCMVKPLYFHIHGRIQHKVIKIEPIRTHRST